MEIVRHSDTCLVKNAINSKIVEGVVMEFIDKKRIVLVLNKSVKLTMIWNGKQYEGRGAGMDFESDGPAVNKSKTGIRG